MMIPGINGSVLASAYKASKLKRRYADGGPIKPSAKLNSVDPQGQASYQAGLQSGPVNLGLRGAANIPQFKNTSLQPSLEYKAKSLSTYLNPQNVGGSYQGKSTYLNADYNIPTQQTNLAAGYNSDKLSLNANANLEKNKLMGAGVDASYNVTPNLSVFGDLRWDKQEGQAPTSYNVGFSYKKQFKDGGPTNPSGGWAGWTPNTGKPLLRTSPAGNSGYSDNTKVITQNTNVTAANRKAAEAAEYAKRVGSVSQGKVKSNYEKAKEASSLVAQAQQRKGSADPIDYVLDAVNPVNYVTNAIDLVGNTGSAAVNASQGNFAQAGSDLLGAGLNALDVVPLTRGLGKVAKPAIKNAAKPFLNYADDVVQTSKIAGKPTLPTYKNVYRAEHANFNTVAKPDDLTGRWALDNPKDAEFYVRNLKTPRGDSYTTSNYFKGEVEPVRIMRDRLPEYKMKQQFAEGMPEEARIMSMGTGKLTDKELASVLGDGAADRMRKGILTEMDYNTMSTAPFMYNTTEGILDANRMNQLRKGENTFLGRGKTNLFPDQKQAIDYISNQSKGQKNSSLISKYLPFSTYKDGGTLPPIYTSNPRDPRIGRYTDSLNSYNLAPAYNKQILTNLQKASTVKQGFQANLKTNEEFQRKGLNYQLGFNRKEVPRQKVSDGFVGAFKYDYKKPVQPYIYKKPEVVPEVIETPVVPAVPVVPVAEPPVKKIGYVKPVIQQFNYMSNENKAKALQKYGSVSDIPFKGVDINQLKKGGEVEDDDDKEMVEGVASILRDVKSKKNRLQLANKLAKQFNREKVDYNLSDFLNKSKVKK